jgi:antitoxin VapB
MPLVIYHNELEQIACELAQLTGKPIEEALLDGTKRELRRQIGIKGLLSRTESENELVAQEVQRIQSALAALPNASSLTDEEILGYDEFGIPTK